MAGAYQGDPSNLAWFQAIWSGSQQNMTTSEIWSSIREAATNQAAMLLGYDGPDPFDDPGVQARATELLSGLTIQDVNSMRATAGQLNAAMANLNSADPEMAVDASMIGVGPNAVTGPDTGLPPIYKARIQYTATDTGGNTFQDWTTVFLQGEPTTVGDLFGRVENELGAQIASGTGTPPATDLTSVDQVSLEVA